MTFPSPDEGFPTEPLPDGEDWEEPAVGPARPIDPPGEDLGDSLDPLDRAYAGLRERLSAAVRRAEEEAEHIRADARAEAERIIDAANAEADERVRELSMDAEQIRLEAEEYARDMRLAVDAYATRQRRDAEEEARMTLEKAEARGRAAVEDAEARARAAQEAAQRRVEELHRESRQIEERRRRVIDGIRDIASQLEDVPVERPADGNGEEPLDLPPRAVGRRR